VEAWKREITLDQVKRWLAFYRIEPWGQPWRQAARQTMFTVTALGAKVKEDFEEMFLPTWDPSRPTQTEDEMLAELMKIPGFKKQLEAKDGHDRES
jgi:hypothetical protein